jgi:hypothetical protein
MKKEKGMEKKTKGRRREREKKQKALVKGRLISGALED